jgi:hypothetical protein
MSTIKEILLSYGEIINIENLTIRHLTDIYTKLPDAPTKADIVYHFFVKNKKSISFLDLNKVFVNKEKLIETLESLIKESYMSSSISLNDKIPDIEKLEETDDYKVLLQQLLPLVKDDKIKNEVNLLLAQNDTIPVENIQKIYLIAINEVKLNSTLYTIIKKK